jgi:hypothetical protein
MIILPTISMFSFFPCPTQISAVIPIPYSQISRPYDIRVCCFQPTCSIPFSEQTHRHLPHFRHPHRRVQRSLRPRSPAPLPPLSWAHPAS